MLVAPVRLVAIVVRLVTAARTRTSRGTDRRQGEAHGGVSVGVHRDAEQVDVGHCGSADANVEFDLGDARFDVSVSVSDERRVECRRGSGAPIQRQGVAVAEWARVHVVEHIPLGTEFLAKVLDAKYATHEPQADRVRLEAKSLARLEHPNIVQVRSFGRHALRKTSIQGCAKPVPIARHMPRRVC